MSLFRHINEISDKGSLKVRGSMMQAIARICLDIITRTKDAPYNWDVIALYCAPPNTSHKQKERYDGADTLTFCPQADQVIDGGSRWQRCGQIFPPIA